MNLPEIKHLLHKHCQVVVNDQIEALEVNLKSIEESRNNETKSSVGDKYETGRAMMQLEHQKVSSQLSRIKAQASELKTIDVQVVSSKVARGSLVFTDQGVYYICTALGKISLLEQVFFCISLQSPIGKLLYQKTKGDVVVFNAKKISIESIG